MKKLFNLDKNRIFNLVKNLFIPTRNNLVFLTVFLIVFLLPQLVIERYFIPLTNYLWFIIIVAVCLFFLYFFVYWRFIKKDKAKLSIFLIQLYLFVLIINFIGSFILIFPYSQNQTLFFPLHLIDLLSSMFFGILIIFGLSDFIFGKKQFELYLLLYIGYFAINFTAKLYNDYLLNSYLRDFSLVYISLNSFTSIFLWHSYSKLRTFFIPKENRAIIFFTLIGLISASLGIFRDVVLYFDALTTIFYTPLKEIIMINFVPFYTLFLLGFTVHISEQMKSKKK